MVQIIVSFSMHVIKTVNGYNFVSKKKEKKRKRDAIRMKWFLTNPRECFFFFLKTVSGALIKREFFSY